MATNSATPGAKQQRIPAPHAAQRTGSAEGDAAEQMRADHVAPAAFTNLTPTDTATTDTDINKILDIPVELSVEMGRACVPLKYIVQLAQNSIVELETMAGEPMDVLINSYLVAQGEVVVVNEKFGIRLTDIVSPSERMRRLSRG